MKKQRTREIVISAILLSVSLSLLSLTYIFASTLSPPIYDLLSKFAFALLVAVVIRLTVVFLYRDRNADLDKFLALGIEKIYDPLSDKNLRDRLGDATEIKVLKTWFPENPEIESGLRQAITEKSANVELLLCHPGSTILKQRSLGADELAWWGDYKVYRAVQNVYDWTEGMSDDDLKVKIWLYDSWPGCPVIWYDKNILMGFYFRGAASPSWPWLSIKIKSRLADILMAQFEDLWNKATEKLSSREDMADWLKRNKYFENPNTDEIE